MSFTTSAIYTVWDVLAVDIAALTFPTAPDAAGRAQPYVWFGDPSKPQPGPGGAPEMPTESVVILSDIETPSTIEWGAIGKLAREETWVQRIRCRSMIRGRTEAQTAARLEELTSTIELYIRSRMQASRQSTGWPAAFDPYGSTWVIAVVRVDPVTAGAEDGSISAADVLVGCKFTINKEAFP